MPSTPETARGNEEAAATNGRFLAEEERNVRSVRLGAGQMRRISVAQTSDAGSLTMHCRVRRPAAALALPSHDPCPRADFDGRHGTSQRAALAGRRPGDTFAGKVGR